MHIIWDRQDHERYYLYIGQSLNVHERITRHGDPGISVLCVRFWRNSCQAGSVELFMLPPRIKAEL